MGVFYAQGAKARSRATFFAQAWTTQVGRSRLLAIWATPPPRLFCAGVLPGIYEPAGHLNIDSGLSFGRLRACIPTYRVL
nr:MAG TPA: hypothetical protein [Caudoviricetes sp.]